MTNAPHDRTVFYLNDEESEVIRNLRRSVAQQRRLNRRRSVGITEEDIHNGSHNDFCEQCGDCMICDNPHECYMLKQIRSSGARI